MRKTDINIQVTGRENLNIHILLNFAFIILGGIGGKMNQLGQKMKEPRKMK